MLRVTLYDIKIENRSLYLGTLWKVLTPLIQIGTYWFVFGIGLRRGAPVDGYPFLVWLLGGMIPWFFFSRSITTGAMSIRSKSAMVFKVKYPIPTIPIGNTIKCLYDHVIMIGIMTVIFLFHGVTPNLYWLNLLYYLFFAFIFLACLSLTLSITVMLAQDLGNLINSLMQLLFFLTPIFWKPDGLSPSAQRLFSLNPAFYIVNGFRDSLLYRVNFFSHPLRMIIFWTMTLILFFAGCSIQKRYGKRIIDWL